MLHLKKPTKLRTVTMRKDDEPMEYTKSDFEKDLDFIREHDGIKFEFPTYNKDATKRRVLIKYVSFKELSLKITAQGDAFAVANWEKDTWKIADAEKEKQRADKLTIEKIKQALKRIVENQDRFKNTPTEPAGTPAPVTNEKTNIIYDKNGYEYFSKLTALASNLNIGLSTLKKHMNDTDLFRYGIKKLKNSTGKIERGHYVAYETKKAMKTYKTK